MKPFNFGPIARTSAGGTHDTINLASFPLHVMLNALVGSTSVEEFIAWLWHDLYKPAFYWKSGAWYHVPGVGAFTKGEAVFANLTKIPIGLVSSHHPRLVRPYHPLWDRKTKRLVDPSTNLPCPKFKLLESDFISDQGDQVNLGATVNYIQLSLAAEPALPTLLTRSVIADAFIQVVTKDVAKALNKKFRDAGRTPIEQVRFEFKTVSNLTFSSPLNDKEIWNKVGEDFDVCMDGNTFIMKHLTPIDDPKHESFETVFTTDLTGNPLSPDEMLKNTFSLAELLVLYQDSRTVIIAVPQDQLYSDDLPRKVQEIQKATLDTSRNRLEKDFKVLTKKNEVDYLKAAFDSQIDIRKVPGRQAKRTKDRPLNEIILHPSKMLNKARKSPSGKVCCLTGTPFISKLPPTQTKLDKLFSDKFVDTEFVGFGEDIAPLTHLYVINSPNTNEKPLRTSLRGSFAFFAPASHFAADDQEWEALGQPPLDIGGRFRNQLNRVTVTTQEFTLFQQMSRRVIAELWQHIAPEEPLPLPYLGAIALTHESKERVRRKLLPHLDLIFSEVALKVYPFESKVCPAIEFALETAIKDAKHAGKHTLLKTTPRIITVDPQSAVPILIDDSEQVSLTKEFFKQANLLGKLTNELTHRKKRLNQKDLWLKLVLSNNDPITAVFESSVSITNMEHTAFHDAEDFWNRHIDDKGDFSESWEEYERLRQNATNALEEFPALLLLLQDLQKQKQVPQKQTKIKKNKASEPQQLVLFPFEKTDKN